MDKKEKLIKILEDAKYLGATSDLVADRILNLFSVVVPKGTLKPLPKDMQKALNKTIERVGKDKTDLNNRL